MTKTDIVLKTVSQFNWPFSSSDVARKLRWRNQETSSVLSYLAKRGDIVLVSKESSESSPIGYVNKYVVSQKKSQDEHCPFLATYSVEHLFAEIRRRMK